MLKHILCILVFAANIRCIAQSFGEKNFVRYTKLDGLSHSYITGIVQDSSGYIWIATNKGLNRFDGKSFTNFFKNTENSPIPENWILSLNTDGKNEIIGSTRAGAFAYNPLTNQRKYFIIPSDSLIFFWTNQGWNALKDKKGNYVVSTKTGLYVFNSTGKIICRYDHYRPGDAGRIELWFGNWLSSLSNGTVYQENNLSGSLYIPATNKIDTFYSIKTKNINWRSTWKIGGERIALSFKDEIFLPDALSNSMKIYNLLTGRSSSYAVPSSILSDIDWQSKIFSINDSTLAVTGKIGGFHLLHYTAGKYLHYEEKKYFASKYCTSVFADREGRLWVGTNDGLYKQNIRNSFFSAQDLSQQLPGILNTGIRSVFLDKEKMLIGLRNDGGLLILNNKTKKIERHIGLEKHGPSSGSINFIFSYHPDTLWMGTGRGIIWLNTKNYSTGRLKIPGKPLWMDEVPVRNFLKDSKGNIWLTFGRINSVVQFNREQYTFYDVSNNTLLKITYCFSIAEDKQGNIWLAGDGLCRWNRKKNEVDTLIPYPSVSKLLFNYMEILNCDENNNLWMSSYDNEILQYDCTNNRMYLRLPANSMLDGYSVTNTDIINDYIWLGMANGISAFNIKNYSIRQFNYADGLPSAVVTSHRKGSFYNKEENRFYFGAANYLISFTPDVNLVNELIPSFSLDATGTKKSLPDEIILPYSQNNVELRFNAINFTDPEENRFSYRMLHEQDSSWHELNSQTVVLLTDLPPGNHQIQARLFSVNNRWPRQFKSINIIIEPPFWKTDAFLVSLWVLIIAVIYLLYYLRIKKVRQKANLDKLLAQTEMKALHSQMNPHFIFNCLNSIREMILNNENGQASRYLSKFAHLIRITLDQSSRPFVSLQHTIDYLQRYIEMEEIRSGHFTYTIEANEYLQLSDIFLPPMLIQPFIENAIWHGVPAPNKNIHINIRFLQKKNQLQCIIEDNGIGIKTSLENKKGMQMERSSIGISNVRQRIQVLNEKYNLHSNIAIEDKNDLPEKNETGTLVTVYLDIKNTSL
jgi:ligand-binding sensor domain-containing protein